MRISDWSSDVCSSDLRKASRGARRAATGAAVLLARSPAACMSQLYRFSEYRSSPRGIFLDRAELNQLLSLYSRNVASGEWPASACHHPGCSLVLPAFRPPPDAQLSSNAKPRTHRPVANMAGHVRGQQKRAQKDKEK